jgi:hypothetical protein
MTAGKFVLKKSSSGKYHFNLVTESACTSACRPDPARRGRAARAARPD